MTKPSVYIKRQRLTFLFSNMVHDLTDTGEVLLPLLYDFVCHPRVISNLSLVGLYGHTTPVAG